MDQYIEPPRKVHFHWDQGGATFGLKKTPFANTLCKMNSAVPDSHITTDPSKVTCKICKRDHRFRTAQYRDNMNVLGEQPTPSVAQHVQIVVRAMLPGFINGMRARYRRNWRGKLILQVEEMVPVNYDDSDPREVRPISEVPHRGRWRDATIADLAIGLV